MIEKESEWILPENLKKQEKSEREEVDKGVFDGRGDFGSYYTYLKGINYELIKPHAVTDDEEAKSYSGQMNHILKEFGSKIGGKVIDIGCAIGTITNSLRELNPEGITYGLDISEDAIQVAKNKYPECIFLSQQADNLDNFDDNSFNIIHAREFYPFTRTNDIEYQLNCLKLFHSKLKPRGLLILQIHPWAKGFSNTYIDMWEDLLIMGYDQVWKPEFIAIGKYNLAKDCSIVQRRIMLPHKCYRLLKRLGYNKIIRLGLLAITKIVYKAMSKRLGYFYILRKGRGLLDDCHY